MTGGTLLRGRPAARPQADERGGFAQVLHAEWTKFRTVRGWVIGMLVAAVIMDLLGLFLAGQGNIECGSGHGPVRTGRACLPPITLGPGGEQVTDSFYFVHKPLARDGSITVRVTSLTGLHGNGNGPVRAGAGPLANMQPGLVAWSKAGIIIKASTKPGSAYAAMMVAGSHGVRMQYDYTGDTAGLPGPVSASSPRWLRLTRSGDTVTGYDSADGRDWIKVGAADLPGLPTTAQAGPFATSPQYSAQTQSFGGSSSQSGPSVATGVFDHLSLRGGGQPGAQLGVQSGAQPGGWAGTDVGAAETALGPKDTGVGFRQAGGRLTVTGSGDIAPVVHGENGAGYPTATVEDHLVGAFAALIAVMVVAVMFITAEYRRGMIRTTLAASPGRGRVLAAKAIVIGAVSFVAGLPAAAIAVAYGTKLSRDQGEVVLPISWATELRAVAGTAALLAVAAVFALALGAIMRRSAAAVTTAIVVIVLPYILAMALVLPVTAGQWLLRLTPAAAFAIQQTTPQYSQVDGVYTPLDGYFPLAPWAGFAVLCGYAALALWLAAAALRRRDA
jgi:ABC-type transport system involved in multi-copper enzyme maturation permease subunit